MPYTLQILHASDWEGGLLATRRAPNFAAIVDRLEDLTPNSITLSTGDGWIPSPFFIAGGDPQMAATYNGVYNQFYGLSGANSYRALTASPGRADITIQNLIGVQAAVFGNHEFDAGPTEVNNIIGSSLGSAAGPADDTWLGAQFPYLSTNLNFSRETALSGRVAPDGQNATFAQTGPTTTQTGTGSDKIARSTIIEENGERILFVGATTQLEAQLTSLGNVTLDGVSGRDDMRALADQINAEVDRQLAANPGIRIVVAGTHLQQLANEQALAPLLRNVDVLIGGGSHTLLSDSNDRLLPGDTSGGAYPQLFTNASGQPIALVNTASEYSYVGRLTATFDDAGNLIPGSISPDTSGAVAADEQSVTQLYGSYNAAFTPGSRGFLVREVIEGLDANNDGIQETAGIADIIRQQDGNILGRTSTYLEGRRGEVRTEETNLGDLSSDAALWYAQRFDPTTTVALRNGGGIRDSIGSFSSTGGGATELPPAANPEANKQAGDVSQLDVTNALRFNNNLSLVSVSATELERILEHAVAATAPGATPGQFAQVSGISYSFDATRQAQVLNGTTGAVVTEGQRIRSAAITDADGRILDTLVQDGQLVGDPNRQIRMVTLDFLANASTTAPALGGDSYPFPAYGENRVNLRDATAANLPNTATFAAQGSEQDALAEYLRAFHSTTPYAVADTTPAGDTRIQNLAARADAVLARGVNRTGTSAAELLQGTSFDDLLTGGGGNDTLDGGAGTDIAAFSGARSQYVVQTVGDGTLRVIDQRLGAPDGTDTLRGIEVLRFSDGAVDVASGAAPGGSSSGGPSAPTATGLTLPGTAGADLLTGGTGNDTLSGLAGNDTLSGREGADLLLGNQGEDLLSGNQGNDTLFGGQGQDTLFGGQDADLLFGNLGADLLLGNLGMDTLYGGQGNDSLYGGQGDDVLFGDLGDDVLSGDLGNDVLRGGAGADRYVFNTNSGADVVLGFNQAEGDRLDLRGQTYRFGVAADGSGSALLVLSGGGTIELAGITQAQVNANFFA